VAYRMALVPMTLKVTCCFKPFELLCLVKHSMNLLTERHGRSVIAELLVMILTQFLHLVVMLVCSVFSM